MLSLCRKETGNINMDDHIRAEQVCYTCCLAGPSSAVNLTLSKQKMSFNAYCAGHLQHSYSANTLDQQPKSLLKQHVPWSLNLTCMFSTFCCISYPSSLLICYSCIMSEQTAQMVVSDKASLQSTAVSGRRYSIARCHSYGLQYWRNIKWKEQLGKTKYAC